MIDRAISDDSPMIESALDFANDLIPMVDMSETTAERNKTAPVGWFRKVALQIACSDETTALTTGTGKATFRSPFPLELLEVRASLTTAQASGNPVTVDVNASGSSIFSVPLRFDNTETTTTTASSPDALSTTTISDDEEIRVDVDDCDGSTEAAGLKVTLIGYIKG